MDGEVPWHVERKENTISRYAWLKTYGTARHGGKRAEETEQRIDTTASEETRG